MNPANATTLTRLLLIPQFSFFISRGLTAAALWYIGLYLVLDVADGFLARRLKCATLFGKNFDIIVDAVGFWSIAIVLLVQGVFPRQFLIAVAFPGAIILTGMVIDIVKTKNAITGNESQFWKGLHGGSWFAILICYILGGAFEKLSWVFLIPLAIVGVRYMRKVLRA